MDKAIKLIEIMREAETLEQAIERAVTELNYTPEQLQRDAEQLNNILSPIVNRAPETPEN